MRSLCLLAVATLLAPSASPLEASEETWTDVSGRTMQAEFVGLDNTDAVFVKNGAEVRVPISRLSPADRDRAIQLNESAKDADDDDGETNGDRRRPGRRRTFENRSWSDTRGNVITARFVRIRDDQVVLSRGGRNTVVPYYNLSDTDQQYIREVLMDMGEEELIPAERPAAAAPTAPGAPRTLPGAAALGAAPGMPAGTPALGGSPPAMGGLANMPGGIGMRGVPALPRGPSAMPNPAMIAGMTGPGAIPGAGPGALPGAIPGAIPGALPGATPGAIPGTVPGGTSGPGTIPGAVPGGISGPGAIPAASPGALPGAAGAPGALGSPGAMPHAGAMPGAMPGATGMPGTQGAGGIPPAPGSSSFAGMNNMPGSAMGSGAPEINMPGFTPPVPEISIPTIELYSTCSNCNAEFKSSEANGKTHCPKCGVPWINQGGKPGTYKNNATRARSTFRWASIAIGALISLIGGGATWVRRRG